LRRLFALFFLALLCHSTTGQSAPRWTGDKIVELRYELIDPARIENYSFNREAR
jgi:hypothetical protein